MMDGFRLNIRLGRKFIIIALNPAARIVRLIDEPARWIDISDVDF
jgi:hypothetical protein